MLKSMLTLLGAKPHIGVMASIGSLPLSIILSKIAAILGPLTIIGGFAIMILTAMIKWREWKRGERKTKPTLRHLIFDKD